MILDNLSAHKATKIKAWCAKHNVELCFTPTYSSWANPISVYRLSADRRARDLGLGRSSARVKFC